MTQYEFDKEPTAAQLWDVCVRNLLYRPQEYVTELTDYLSSKGVTKASLVADVAAGGGFPALDLAQRGFQNITCYDMSDDAIALFAQRAVEVRVPLNCEKLPWLELSGQRTGTHDVVLCRGNSFIYAAGGWGCAQQVDACASIAAYSETLRIFRSLLAPGGLLYLDKFKDDESPGEHHVMNIIVAGNLQRLYFKTAIDPVSSVRHASQLLKDYRGEIRGVPNMAYNLTTPELRSLLVEAGFVDIEQPIFRTESYFRIITARAPV